MSEKEKISNAVAALQSAAETIRRLEDEAREALYVRDDPATYRQKLLEKTILLTDLPDVARPLCNEMPAGFRSEFISGLRSFAIRAHEALELSSIFYMSALLYPDDYREGDPNDLESFIDRLRGKYLFCETAG
jgi:hypothetical protein